MQTRLGSALGTSILMSLAIASMSIAQTGTISGRVTAVGSQLCTSAMNAMLSVSEDWAPANCARKVVAGKPSIKDTNSRLVRSIALIGNPCRLDFYMVELARRARTAPSVLSVMRIANTVPAGPTA